MRKTLLMGVALVASSAVMGQISDWNEMARTSNNRELVLDSVVTKTRDDNPEKKVVYGYDAQKRKAYEVSISYSQWTTPAYKPTYGDSISYEYSQKGFLVKASTYRNESSNDVVDYQLNLYIDYEYNDKDQWVKETTYRYNQNVEAYIDNTINEYEYAADGSLVRKIESARPSGAPWETGIKPMQVNAKTEYSNFLAVDVPRKAESYLFSAGTDGGEGVWRLNYYVIMTYDDKNQQTMKEQYGADSQASEGWSVSIRYTYTLNDKGQVTYEEYSNKNFATGIVEVSSKKTYTYDANGNLTKRTSETFQAYKDAWVPDSSHSYYYAPPVSTSIQNAGTQNVGVYYNASSKEICIQAEGNIGSICVYSVSGLETIRVSAVNNSQYTLNVSNLDKGLYIVNLIADGEVYNKKVYIYE